MNKQQLASKIWEAANQMRGKIDAIEYKDFILGFIFYKFLSQKEEKLLKTKYYLDDKTIENVTENTEISKAICEEIGYFISYDNLFSSWVKTDVTIDKVVTAMSAFERNINDTHRNVYKNIFKNFTNGLDKLGNNPGTQTDMVKKLVFLVDDIPMNKKQDYDILGYIYEFLISNFAQSAGKKAGEFYTPHEVSKLMAEIISYHLKDRDEIEVYDPTSGSGSLLLNIGESIKKYIKQDNKVRYYAQELIENTYNLTRMNLVMKGIIPSNIIVRNGDTLKDDWPFFDENHQYNPLFVDAVVSNPPYSQSWNSQSLESDPRFREYGIAPKSKADYAFLLHDLYHLNSKGIMAIVLPHGVLFRGSEEAQIRKNLIENNNIDAIIGLPGNIFYGTPIPTIVMILRKERDRDDTLIIDASKGFIKEGKNNKLRSSDIKKIFDTYVSRKNLDKFSRVVTRDEIRKNDYNLNIPRYVDSSEDNETYDMYAIMNGGIPKSELNSLNKYFNEFPNIKNEIFEDINSNYVDIKIDNVHEYLCNHKDIKTFKSKIYDKFKGFDQFLYNELINNLENIDLQNEETVLSDELFERIDNINLIDKYKSYQILDDLWNMISGDIEIIQNEGIESCRVIDPIMEKKKKNDKSIEVQVGEKGRIIPFDLVANYKLNDTLNNIQNIENDILNVDNEISDLFDNIEDKESISVYLNEDNTEFASKEISKKAKEILKNKNEKSDFDNIILSIYNLFEKKKNVEKELKEASNELTEKTKLIIKDLTIDDIKYLLQEKWIKPVISDINKQIDDIISTFNKKVENLGNKYKETLPSITNEIEKNEKSLLSMLDELTGDEYDMKAIEDLKQLIGGDIYE